MPASQQSAFCVRKVNIGDRQVPGQGRLLSQVWIRVLRQPLSPPVTSSRMKWWTVSQFVRRASVLGFQSSGNSAGFRKRTLPRLDSRICHRPACVFTGGLTSQQHRSLLRPVRQTPASKNSMDKIPAIVAAASPSEGHSRAPSP
jgi:hypothetical protein